MTHTTRTRTAGLRLISFFALLILTFSANAAMHAFLYSGGVMADLGILGGTNRFPNSFAYGINNNDQVVGSSGHAFLYSGGAMTDLGTLGGVSSAAYDINDNGQVVGWAFNAVFQGGRHAFLYSGGAMADLGTLGGRESVANAINDNGQVVGWSDTGGSGGSQAFLYSSGVMTNLGATLNLGGFDSFAYDINDSGQVVGYFATGSGAQAFLYSDGVKTNLGTLGGRYSRATGINDNGQVVGWSTINTTDPNTQHPFLHSGGVMMDLNTLLAPDSGWILNSASAINDLGQIVGSGSINGESHAFLYSDGVVTDLGTLGYGVTATDINNDGQVVGYFSTVPLPSSVPIPPAVWLLGSGLLGLLGIARRRKH